MNKLWLLTPIDESTHWEPWYDKAFAFVCRCPTEQAARALAQSRTGAESGLDYETLAGYDNEDDAVEDGYVPVWLNPALTSCVELTADGDSEIVCRDFRSA